MWTVRPITEDEAALFRSRIARGFGSDPKNDEESIGRFLEVFEIERTFAAFDGEDIVGTGGAFSFQLTVPGRRTVGMGGTTIIAVQPTHRRRGVLSAMMGYHLDEVAKRGEPLAGLWASESSIYGRFGYGVSSEMWDATMEAGRIVFPEPVIEGAVELIDHEDAEPLLRTVFEAARLERPGMLSRSDTWWRLRRMRDPEDDRNGMSARRYAVYRVDGEVEGYATFRQKEKWDEPFAAGKVSIIELIALTPRAHTALWSFLTNIDLFPTVVWWNMPVDDPLPAKVTDGRRVLGPRFDSLWLRILDVPAALEARGYERDGELVFSIRDDARTAGTYRLTVSAGEGRCHRVEGFRRRADDPDALSPVPRRSQPQPCRRRRRGRGESGGSDRARPGAAHRTGSLVP